jgi:hypothetical protein
MVNFFFHNLIIINKAKILIIINKSNSYLSTKASPICKHIAKAPQTNSKSLALSKSLQSRPYSPTGLFVQRSKNKINLYFVDSFVHIDRMINLELNI